jgi:SAM-dependent methyltransferase
MAQIVDIPRFNTVLNNWAREYYLPATNTLFALVPDMMGRKIAEANVQQSFVLASVLRLSVSLPRTKVLCVGCFEDTAYEALRLMGYPVRGFDPNVDGCDLDAFVQQNPESLGTFDVIFSTSVIEHVQDDEEFVSKIARLLRVGGYAILTCDYLDGWKPGDTLPSSDFRFYTSHDLYVRLLAHMPGCHLVDDADWEKHEPDFAFAGCRYGFATFVAEKRWVP